MDIFSSEKKHAEGVEGMRLRNTTAPQRVLTLALLLFSFQLLSGNGNILNAAGNEIFLKKITSLECYNIDLETCLARLSSEFNLRIQVLGSIENKHINLKLTGKSLGEALEELTNLFENASTSIVYDPPLNVITISTFFKASDGKTKVSPVLSEMQTGVEKSFNSEALSQEQQSSNFKKISDAIERTPDPESLVAPATSLRQLESLVNKADLIVTNPDSPIAVGINNEKIDLKQFARFLARANKEYKDYTTSIADKIAHNN